MITYARYIDKGHVLPRKYHALYKRVRGQQSGDEECKVD